MELLTKFLSSALLICLLLLPGCGAKEITSVAEIRKDASLVIARVYAEHRWNKRQQSMDASFVRFEPAGPRESFFFRSSAEKISADDALPGQYHFRFFSTIFVDYLFEPHNPRYEVEVRPGEAVYIGDIVNSYDSHGRFRIILRDKTDEARAYFESKFAASGLEFRKRLMRHVSK